MTVKELIHLLGQGDEDFEVGFIDDSTSKTWMGPVQKVMLCIDDDGPFIGICEV